MKSKDTNSKVVTRDMPSKGEGSLQDYFFPKLKVTVQATSLQEAQIKAEAKAKALSNNN